MKPRADISPMGAWLLAARPKTLPAAVAPVCVGTALAAAHGRLAWMPAAAALACAFLLQIGVNLANDYFDCVRHVDTRDRVGPVRVTQSGLIPPQRVRRVMWAVFACTALPGAYLTAVAGWPMVAVGAVSILAALAYSGGPFPLASHALGDPAVFLFFGPVAVCGTYFAQAHQLNGEAFRAAVPVGLLITAILVVNNLRDIPTDGRVGKRTLAVRMGATGSRVEFTLLLAGAFAAVVAMWLRSGGSPWLLLPMVSLPMAGLLVGAIATGSGADLNRVLAQTALLALLFSLLLAAGIVMGL